MALRDIDLKYEGANYIQTGKSLVVSAPGAARMSSLPLGRSGYPAQAGINLVGSFAGGEDSGSGTDTTAHLSIYSYQRAQTGSYGESIRFFHMLADAKTGIAGYFPKAGYADVSELPDESEGWTPQFWGYVFHAKANDNLSYHNHVSLLELLSPDDGLATRLSASVVEETWQIGDGYRVGVNVANFRTNRADWTIAASGGVLRIGGGTSFNKDLVFSTSAERASSAERWKIRVTNDAESTGNAGSNWTLRRHDDSGSFIGTAIWIARSSGNTTIGASGSTNAKLGVVWGSGADHGVRVAPTTSPGAFAGVDAEMTALTDRAFQTMMNGDTSRRWVVFADGKTEWGDGTTRDTNLYRSAADRLKTDDSLQVGLRFAIGQVPDATITQVITQTADANGIYIQNTMGGSGNANQAHIRMDSQTPGSLTFSTRVAGDAQSRWIQRIDGQMQWGDGTNARDVTLYRTAADVLKTDDSFVAATRLAVGVSAIQTATVHADSTGTINTALFRATAAGTATLGVLQVESNDNTKRLLDLRVTGDSVPRLRVDMSSGTGAGTIGFGHGTTLDTVLYRGGADLLMTDDDFAINTAGKGIKVKEGSNARLGTATLVAGTVTVANTSVTANSRILLTVQSLGTVTAPKSIAVTARVAATSFTITSSDATDTSVVAYHIIEPA